MLNHPSRPIELDDLAGRCENSMSRSVASIQTRVMDCIGLDTATGRHLSIVDRNLHPFGVSDRSADKKEALRMVISRSTR
jgi:hypothetical protein